MSDDDAPDNVIPLFGRDTVTEEDVQELIEMFRRGPDPENVIKLSAQDWEHLMDLLENPPEPTEEMKKLFQDYLNRRGE